MPVGTVKFFNADKGYGFIKQDGDDADVFVHGNEVKDCGFGTLTKGQRVEFEVRPGAKGDKAVNLKAV